MSSAKKNLLDAAARQLLKIFGNDPAAARRAAEQLRTQPTRPAAATSPRGGGEARQLRLPLTQPGRGAQTYSPAKSAAPGTAEVVRASMRPSLADTPRVRLGGEAPGQLPLDAAPVPEFSVRRADPTAQRTPLAQLSPEALALAEADPGTFNAIRQIAARAEDAYGINEGGLLNALVERGGTDVLRYLDEGADLQTAVARARSGGPLVPSGSSGAGELGRRGALVRSPGGEAVSLDVEPVDVRLIETVRSLRNAAGGAQQTNLAQMLGNVPAEQRQRLMQILAGAGGVAGGAGLVNIGRSMMEPDTATSRPLITEDDGSPLGAPGTSNLDQLRITPPGAVQDALGADPTRTGAAVVVPSDNGMSARREAMAQYAPEQAILERALEPRDPSSYRNIQEYYRDRERYANQPGRSKELAAFARTLAQDAAQQQAMETWARSNPELAYQLQQQALRNPAANQQSSESVTVPATPTTPLGSDIRNNPVGAAEAAAAAAIAPTQGNFEMQSATEMIPQKRLVRAQNYLTERLREYSAR